MNKYLKYVILYFNIEKLKEILIIHVNNPYNVRQHNMALQESVKPTQ